MCGKARGLMYRKKGKLGWDCDDQIRIHQLDQRESKDVQQMVDHVSQGEGDQFG